MSASGVRADILEKKCSDVRLFEATAGTTKPIENFLFLGFARSPIDLIRQRSRDQIGYQYPECSGHRKHEKSATGETPHSSSAPQRCRRVQTADIQSIAQNHAATEKTDS